MVKYKYTDQLAATKNHVIGINNYNEMKHCVQMNSQINWLIDTDCWLLNLENSWNWLKIAY